MKKIIMIIAGAIVLGVVAGLIWLYVLKPKSEGSKAGETTTESTVNTDDSSNGGNGANTDGVSAVVSTEEFETVL